VLRGTLSQNWVEVISQIVDQYNATPKQKLGGLSPQNIHSESDSVLVNEARKKNNISVFEEPHYQQQILNQKNYENDSSKLQVNNYVYLSSNEKLFDKSFDTQANQISLLSKILKQNVRKCLQTTS